MKLSPSEEKFIVHWGEMGSRWGVNRTVSQIHALLFLSEEPMHAEQIVQTLSVARSNVSTSLKELQGWGLVKTVHVLGDRRDHFEALSDVWAIFQAVSSERRKRELDPTLSMLRSAQMENDSTRPYAREKMDEVLEFLEMLTHWMDEVQNLPQPVVTRIFRMGAKIQGLLGKR